MNKEAEKYMKMMEDETDPDNIQILELDVQRELGLDPKEIKKMLKKIKGKKMGGLSGSTMMGQDLENYMGDEASAAGNSKGGGAAIRGLKFIGLR
tara:strand:- start:141 stop:425 length:285 start_codon:yes stop_codon:yes gene_type:complete